MPLVTLPKAQCLPSSHAVCTVHRKNCEPLVLGQRWPSSRRGGVLEPILIHELSAVDGLAAMPLWLRGSPPWHMNWGITRWKEEPLKPKPFSPVHSARKFSVGRFRFRFRFRTTDPARRFVKRDTVHASDTKSFEGNGGRVEGEVSGSRSSRSRARTPSRETTTRTTERLSDRGRARVERLGPGDASRVERGDALSSRSARAIRCRQKAIAPTKSASRQNI